MYCIHLVWRWILLVKGCSYLRCWEYKPIGLCVSGFSVDTPFLTQKINVFPFLERIVISPTQTLKSTLVVFYWTLEIPDIKPAAVVKYELDVSFLHNRKSIFNNIIIISLNPRPLSPFPDMLTLCVCAQMSSRATRCFKLLEKLTWPRPRRPSPWRSSTSNTLTHTRPRWWDGHTHTHTHTHR